MRRLLLLFSACTLMCIACSAHADQYVLSLQGKSLPYAWSVDFGHQFASIESLTLDLSGDISYSSAHDVGYVAVSAYLSTDSGPASFGEWFKGEYGTIGSESFRLSNTIIGPLPCLADGKAVVNIDHRIGVFSEYWLGSNITNAKLTLNATPVSTLPEPSSVLALAGGLVGLIGLRRRNA